MYLPKHFQVEDHSTLYAFIAAKSFATLVSVIDGAPFATHLPMLIDVDEAGGATLLGHVAMGNKHHRVFDGEHETLAIFHGPHAYVSPAWYAKAPAVPTWNYVAVHVTGRPVMVDDEAWLAAFVDRLTAYFDPDYATASPEIQGYAEMKSKLLKGIVGFRMPVERIEGKYKLSQNRSEADRQGVIDHLSATEPAVAELMQD